MNFFYKHCYNLLHEVIVHVYSSMFGYHWWLENKICYWSWFIFVSSPTKMDPLELSPMACHEMPCICTEVPDSLTFCRWPHYICIHWPDIWVLSFSCSHCMTRCVNAWPAPEYHCVDNVSSGQSPAASRRRNHSTMDVLHSPVILTSLLFNLLTYPDWTGTFDLFLPGKSLRPTIIESFSMFVNAGLVLRMVSQKNFVVNRCPIRCTKTYGSQWKT